MESSQKNIWTLFYIIIFLIVSTFIFLIVNTHISTKKDFIVEEENLTKIKANSLSAIFSQYETILNIIENQLIIEKNYQSINLSEKVLNSVLINDNNILGFALFKPNGDLYLTNNKNNENFPNLLEKEETKKSFEYTMQKDSIVLGRTYYSDIRKKFILPIRKTIRDKKGEILFVLSIIIDANKIQYSSKNEKYKHHVFRGFDYFYQIYNENENVNEKNNPYEKPVPKELLENIKESVEKKYNKSVEEIKNSEEVITFESKNYNSYDIELVSSKYLKAYELWVITQIPINEVNKVFFKKLVYLFILLVIIYFILYYLFSVINHSEEKKQKALEFQAYHDYLTNLYNRLFIIQKFKIEKNKPFSLFFINVDNFKSVNNSHGHNYGDDVLKEISLRLIELKNSNDYLIRYSGDEFIFIVYDTNLGNIKELASKILKSLRQPYNINSVTFTLSCSIGIARYPDNAENFNEIKRYADIAMYESKKEKNKYTIFEDSVKDIYIKKLLMEYELKSSLKNNEMYMMYQPQIDINGNLYGVEALVRWENKNLGFVSPDKFIEIAEATGFMKKLGDFIINTSLKEIFEIQKLCNKKFQLSINISVKQFIEKDFNTELLNMIKKSGFDIKNVTLEITENVCIEDIDYIINLLKEFKQHSIKISLDDFGTGYSSLSLLKKLPIDELKIDKSFVDDILVNSSSKKMIENIISIGKNLDLVILAEGIEELEQKNLLESYGTTLFQGYYYSKPLKKDELLKFINKK